jgi:cytochrome c oxidase assembly protein subunit 15
MPPSAGGAPRLAAVLVALTFVLVFWGGQVTTTLSGDSVPTWPASFFVPKDAPQTWELGHRWIAGAVGLVTLVLCVVVLRRGRRGLRQRLAVGASGLVVVQALVGGIRVLAGEAHSNAWPIVHTLLAQAFLACVVALAASLRSWPAGAGGPSRTGAPEPDRRLPPAFGGSLEEGPARAGGPDVGGIGARARTLAAVTWVQAGLGAVLRHETQDRNHIGLVLHVAGAMIVIVFAVRLIALVRDRAHDDRRFRVLVHALAAAVALQIVLGLSAWVTTHTAEGYLNPTDARSLVPTLHLVLGSAILALAVVIGMRARPRPGVA